MWQKKIKLGIIGNGLMVRTEYLPYLERRINEKQDIEIEWVSGCLCGKEERKQCTIKVKSYNHSDCKPGRSDSWKNLLYEKPVDGVIISLPNSLHANAIQIALANDVNVAVDKPTTIRAKECSELIKLADSKKLIFLTCSQRRYEEVYKTAASIVKNGNFGNPQLINYMVAREYDFRGNTKWQTNRDLSGGGALIADGYHGIDTIMWLLRHGDPTIKASSVSGRWILDNNSFSNKHVETVIVLRIMLSNGGIFNIIASYASPVGSLDENIKMFGSKGAIRIMRDRAKKTEQSAANLSFQEMSGLITHYDTSKWKGKRWAPLEDFIDGINDRKLGNSWKILSPARESLQTIEIIEKAYESAEKEGLEISM